MRNLFILALLFISALPALAQRTFYIDFVNGSNMNAGTTPTTAWKSHPNMQRVGACSGSVTSWNGWVHAAGDRFVFKGGVTWPAACFGMAIRAGGSSASVRDYYGNGSDIGVTYGTGKAIFDLANTVPTSVGGGNYNSLYISADFILVDDIEIKRQKLDGVVSSVNAHDAGIKVDGAVGTCCGAVQLKDVYVHDWIATWTGTPPIVSTTAGGGISGGSAYITVTGAVVEDDAGTPVPVGGCFKDVGLVENSECHHTGQGINGFSIVRGSSFHDLTAAYGNAPYCLSSCPHTNLIQQTWGVPAFIYNSTMYNNNVEQQIDIGCPGSAVYNNVMYGSGGQGDFVIHHPFTTCNPPLSSSSVSWFYNNTIYSGTTGKAALHISSNVNVGTYLVDNNHFITDSGPLYEAEVAGPVFTDGGHNKIQTSAQAAAQNYTVTNKFAPQSGSVITVDAGGTKTCSGELSLLCFDVKGTFWAGGTQQARLAPWDVGAYQWATSNTSGDTTAPVISNLVPVNGATVSGTTTLSATCTDNVAVQSVKFYVDGALFATDTTNPYSASWVTTGASNGTHTIRATCMDNSGNASSAPVTGLNNVTVSNLAAGCTTSTTIFQSQAFTAMTGDHQVVFTATPAAINEDAVIGLSFAPLLSGDSYGDLSALVRFGPAGVIEAFNGATGLYGAALSVPYSAATPYTVTMTQNMTANTYTVKIGATTLASNYAFRSTAAAPASLGYISEISGASPATIKVCNVLVNAIAGVSSPAAPTSLTVGIR